MNGNHYGLSHGVQCERDLFGCATTVIRVGWIVHPTILGIRGRTFSVVLPDLNTLLNADLVRSINQPDRASRTLQLHFLRMFTEKKDSSASETRGETEANIWVADEDLEKAVEKCTIGSKYYLGWGDRF